MGLPWNIPNWEHWPSDALDADGDELRPQSQLNKLDTAVSQLIGSITGCATEMPLPLKSRMTGRTGFSCRSLLFMSMFFNKSRAIRE